MGIEDGRDDLEGSSAVCVMGHIDAKDARQEFGPAFTFLALGCCLG